MFAGNPVFSYQADFAPIELLAGRFLLSLVNDTTGQTEQWLWHMHSSAAGNMVWTRLNNNPNWSGPGGSEMSFQIYAVPELGTGAMMGVAGLFLLRRSRRKATCDLA
ncbi:MAG: hypothetical protein IPK83_17975 [Planctomycetes bacterium]|nr:hypothetical protein [Planctomycetota bacterium]